MITESRVITIRNHRFGLEIERGDGYASYYIDYLGSANPRHPWKPFTSHCGSFNEAEASARRFIAENFGR